MTAASSYTVVARRYRPQRFEDVVGQDHVVQSLKNAIRLNRIAQAYLFCGTRGVGKTSIARIFAKCLNCVRGPTESPCQTCDICQAITVGQDVDVIEIDGASNNGVEQVRELRQHASLRPSRSRYKIYYIDEVHMLSTGAFNALLKTLEEPPPHVKFLFATTEPNKIPITVLSRCQRYDFAGITPEAIAGTLGEICTREGVESEPEAAPGRGTPRRWLAARCAVAAGPPAGLRQPQLTVEVVHTLLGTATDERLLKMLEALADHDSAAALGLLEQSASEGVQPAELLGGLIDLLRDAMVLAVGAESMLLAISPRNRDQLKSIVDRWTLESILAALQILAEVPRPDAGQRPRAFAAGNSPRSRRPPRRAHQSLSSLVERLAALESGAPPRRPDPGPATTKSRIQEAAAPLRPTTPCRDHTHAGASPAAPCQRRKGCPQRTGASQPEPRLRRTRPATDAELDVGRARDIRTAVPAADRPPAAARAPGQRSDRTPAPSEPMPRAEGSRLATAAAVLEPPKTRPPPRPRIVSPAPGPRPRFASA